MALDVNAFLVKPSTQVVFLDRLLKILKILESGERWIKPVESYLCIDSESMIQSILEKPQTDIKSSPDKINKEQPQPPQQQPQQPKQQQETEQTEQSPIDDSTLHSKRVSKAIKNQHKKNLLKTTLYVETHHVQKDMPSIIQDSPSSKSSLPASKMKCCRLGTIPLNSILAKDLYGSNGRKLLSTSVKLTKEMIDRLKDLSAIGEPIDEVWIHFEE